MNIDNGSGQTGLSIDQWTCTGASNQSFVFTPTTDGFYTIQSQGNGLCLDAGLGPVTVGSPVVQAPCSSSNAQKWRPSAGSDGLYVIGTFSGAGCLDVYAGRIANGTLLTTYSCHAASNESFLMSGFHPGASPTGSVLSAFVSTMVIQSSGSCVDVIGGSSQAGAGIDQWSCSGNSNQSFAFIPTSDGYYNIQPQNGSLCLDAGAGPVTTGIPVFQNTCSLSVSQKWRVTLNDDTSFAVMTPDGTGCLDVYAGRVANGTSVTTYACHGSSNERFQLSHSLSAVSKTAAPVISPASGRYAPPLSVSVTPAVPGTAVYYTTDGSAPTVASSVYTAPFLLSASATVQAIAVAGGAPASSVASGTFTIQMAQTAAPSISPVSGTYTSPLTVTITPASSGTPVYYTVDGSTPTVSSKLYSSPISLTTSATVRAFSLAAGAAQSAVVSSGFAVTTPATPPAAVAVSVATMVVQSSGSCMNVDNGSSQIGFGIDQWVCTGASNQSFLFAPTSDGHFTIQPQNDSLCLDAGSGSVTAAVQVVQSTCTGMNSQKWNVLPLSNGYYAVSTFSGEGCLDVYAGRTANGTALTTYACHQAGNESFLLAGFTPGISTQPGGPTSPSSSSANPTIFNYSASARAGDVIYIQGANFDTTALVWLGNAAIGTGTPLNVINRVGSTWIAAQIPQSWFGAMFLYVSNTTGNSGVVKLNGAIPFHLDALQLVPGGAFRVLGRNLTVAGYTPSVTVDGRPAVVNLNASSETMLVVTAPSNLSSTSASVILVDNGNGTGAAKLDRVIAVSSGSGDPFSLGVGWGAAFTFAGRVIMVNTPCNGSGDDSGKIQAALDGAAGSGGVVQLPAGTCVLGNSLTMHSNVVLQGAGKDVTTLKYLSNYPISSQSSDLVGIRNFTLMNSGTTLEGLLWKQNTRSFFQNVRIAEMVSRQLYLTGNRNFIVTQSDFVQTGSVGGQNPYLFNDCAGFVFSGNTSVAVDGSPTFSSVHDALILNNRFSRSSVNQNEAVVIATHQFVMDFQYRTAIVGNTFDVVNGPLTNTNRNDGETLLTEGGGGNRTENLGTVVSATSNTLSDPGNTINVNPFGNGLPENYGVAIVAGTGAGQTREVVGYAGGTLQVDRAWDVIPDRTSHYATFVWGLEKTLIEGNTLVGNPRGIWLYQTAVRDVDVSGNTIVNGGGIFLRTFESQNARQFDSMYNVRIANNTIGNSDHIWMSYTNAVFVNKDVLNFGTADTGIEIRGNSVTANIPNVSSAVEDYAGNEGYTNVMRSETSGGQLNGTPMLLGTILQNNQCVNCATAFVIGTGDYGTVLFGNMPTAGAPNFLSDWQTLGSGAGGSVATVIR